MRTWHVLSSLQAGAHNVRLSCITSEAEVLLLNLFLIMSRKTILPIWFVAIQNNQGPRNS